jgi:hypothetical protein
MTELTDILPPALKEILDSLDYEGDGGIIFRSVSLQGEDLIYEFSIKPWGESWACQVWRMQVKNYSDFKLEAGFESGYLSFYSDHFLLWEYTDINTELYVSQPANNPESLLAYIYMLHANVFDGLISAETYVNGSLMDACKSKFGLFARGPEKVLRHYFKFLETAGMKPYYCSPKFRNSNSKLLETKQLKLALIGDKYFIGTDFIFERVE